MTAADVPPTPVSREAEIRARLTKARKTISALCHGGKWIMSVPVRLNEDPDVILSVALDDIEPLLATVSRLSEERDAADEATRQAEDRIARLTASRDAATPRSPEGMTVMSLVCGPTCGCGKSTSFTRAGEMWESPKTCMHCGKAFGPAFYVADPSGPAPTTEGT